MHANFLIGLYFDATSACFLPQYCLANRNYSKMGYLRSIGGG